MGNKILMGLRSRTVWAGVALFVLSGFHGVQDLLPTATVMPIEAILTFLVAYFRVNSKA